MVMNAWFFIAIILGVIVGETSFGRFKRCFPLSGTYAETSECCWILNDMRMFFLYSYTFRTIWIVFTCTRINRLKMCLPVNLTSVCWALQYEPLPKDIWLASVIILSVYKIGIQTIIRWFYLWGNPWFVVWSTFTFLPHSASMTTNVIGVHTCVDWD